MELASHDVLRKKNRGPETDNRGDCVKMHTFRRVRRVVPARLEMFSLGCNTYHIECFARKHDIVGLPSGLARSRDAPRAPVSPFCRVIPGVTIRSRDLPGVEPHSTNFSAPYPRNVRQVASMRDELGTYLPFRNSFSTPTSGHNPTNTGTLVFKPTHIVLQPKRAFRFLRSNPAHPPCPARY